VAVPGFSSGWLAPEGGLLPYLAYGGEDGGSAANWSESLERLHSETGADHFIDVQTRWSVLRALDPGRLPPRPVIADLGCSSGAMLSVLARTCPDAQLVGLDAVAAGLLEAHHRVPHAALFLASATELPFGDASTDAVVALNLLEHLSDDRAALREVARVLVPEGRAVFVVPWNAALYDGYDAFLEHERRYARGELGTKATACGLRVAARWYVGSVIYPPFAVAKRLGRRRWASLTRPELERQVRRRIESTRRSTLGGAAMRVERCLLRAGVRVPFGVRELLVVERA
jgi:SAM-dependent methyltransferase